MRNDLTKQLCVNAIADSSRATYMHQFNKVNSDFTFAATPQRVLELLERVDDIESLRDRLKNGIKYDEEHNQYIVVWTKREIEEAKKDADEIWEALNGGKG